MKAETFRQIFSYYLPNEINRILRAFPEGIVYVKKTRFKKNDELLEKIIIRFKDLTFQKKLILLEGGDVIRISRDKIIYTRHLTH